MPGSIWRRLIWWFPCKEVGKFLGHQHSLMFSSDLYTSTRRTDNMTYLATSKKTFTWTWALDSNFARASEAMLWHRMTKLGTHHFQTHGRLSFRTLVPITKILFPAMAKRYTVVVHLELNDEEIGAGSDKLAGLEIAKTPTYLLAFRNQSQLVFGQIFRWPFFLNLLSLIFVYFYFIRRS